MPSTSVRSLVSALAFAACSLALHSVAQPQQPPQAPSNEQPTIKLNPVPVPPSQPMPAGTLDGLSPPAFDPRFAAPVVPPSREKSGIVASDMLLTRNATNSHAWVSIYQGGIVRGGGCVAPKAEYTFFLERGLPARIRAEATRDADCSQRGAACDTSIDLAPGTKGLELRATGQACAWQVVSGGMLKRAPRGFTTMRLRNVTPYPAWIHLYGRWGGTKCVDPGQTYDFHVQRNDWIGKYDPTIRVEFTRNANCQHPVLCDSRKMDISWSGPAEYKYIFEVRYDPRGSGIPFFPNCWFKFIEKNNYADH